MIKILLCSLAALILLPMLSGCGWFKKKPKPNEQNSNLRLSGRVYKVDEKSRYVLIRRYGPWHVGEGDVVDSRGEGRTASLLPTGERLGEHVAADIRSGTVEIGDAVYIRKISTTKKLKPSASPEGSVKPENEPQPTQDQ